MKRQFITLILALALTIGAQAQQDDGMDAMMNKITQLEPHLCTICPAFGQKIKRISKTGFRVAPSATCFRASPSRFFTEFFVTLQSEDCEDWLHLGIRASSFALGFLRPYGNKRPRSSGTIFVGSNP